LSLLAALLLLLVDTRFTRSHLVARLKSSVVAAWWNTLSSLVVAVVVAQTLTLLEVVVLVVIVRPCWEKALAAAHLLSLP